MSTSFSGLILVLLSIFHLRVYAGAGVIAVSDSGKWCEESGPEFMVMKLTSHEAIESLQLWVQGKPQILNITEKHIQSDWDQKSLQNFLEVAFDSGSIKFCGKQERQKYFASMVDSLKVKLSNERLFVLFLFHAKAKEILSMVRDSLKTATGEEIFVENLKSAVTLIEYQKKTPERYPTVQAVKRILKRSTYQNK